MSDTARDELRERVADGIMDAIGLDAWESDDTFILHAHDLYPAVDKVVEIVTAARDAEIQSAMLHEDVIGTMHSQLLYFGTTEHGVALAVEYALGMIGLSKGQTNDHE